LPPLVHIIVAYLQCLSLVSGRLLTRTDELSLELFLIKI
jgi:hypothetical protein